MNFIHKIFKEEIDQEVHTELIKFSRGIFEDKYLIEGKKQKDKVAIKTSAEFANFLVKSCLKSAQDSLQIKGIIISTYDLSNDINFGFEVKKFMGIQKYIIKSEIQKQDLIELMEKHPKVFFGLSFSTPKCELKIKEKTPKSGKPSTTEKEARAGFCSLKTSDMEIVNDLLFDISEFNEVKIRHAINIVEIIYPDNIDSLKPEEIREQSKRKGKIIRIAEIDGNKKITEKEFIA